VTSKESISTESRISRAAPLQPVAPEVDDKIVRRRLTGVERRFSLDLDTAFTVVKRPRFGVRNELEDLLGPVSSTGDFVVERDIDTVLCSLVSNQECTVELGLEVPVEPPVPEIETDRLALGGQIVADPQSEKPAGIVGCLNGGGPFGLDSRERAGAEQRAAAGHHSPDSDHDCSAAWHGVL